MALSLGPRRLLPLAVLLFLGGCTLGPTPQGTRPDPAAVKSILFRVAPDRLAELPEARRRELAEIISRNLASWGYPVAADAENYSHVLEAWVGPVERKSTPPGFSLGFGNVDPRAVEFQKADVLPVDCVLYPTGRPRDRASMYMDFIAAGMLRDPVRAAADPAAREIYVNHMATVCFNLLDDLKVRRAKAPSAAAAEGSATPSWLPEVRIEVREKPAVPESRPAAAPAGPTAVPAPAAAPPSASDTQPEPQPGTPPARPAQPDSAKPKVTTETRIEKQEGRKQMIIHNQGAPIILEFGYERR